MKRFWPMGYHLTSRFSSIYKASSQPLESFCFSQICLSRVNQPILLMPKFFITIATQCPSNCLLPRFPGMTAITVNNAGLTSKAKDFQSNCHENALLSSGTPPVTQECARGIPALLRERQV
ncbi:hypothetical protein TNCV_3187601 [Trichonephila clavipes]|nr:hypothetical protein TNCV_3187601 [Trichonephila clavipes]